MIFAVLIAAIGLVIFYIVQNQAQASASMASETDFAPQSDPSYSDPLSYMLGDQGSPTDQPIPDQPLPDQPIDTGLQGFDVTPATGQLTYGATGPEAAFARPTAFDSLFQDYAAQVGVDPALIKALAAIESSYNPQGYNPGDPSYGLCGVSKIACVDVGETPPSDIMAWLWIPDNNVRVAAKYAHKICTAYRTALEGAGITWEGATSFYDCYNIGPTAARHGKKSPYRDRFARIYAAVQGG